jgi:peroxiredoxin
LPEIRRWQKEYDEELTISLVSRGTVEANRAKSTEHGLRGLLLQDDWEVSEAYGVESTPSAVLVRPDGTIGSPVLDGADSISAFLEYAMRERDWLPIRHGGEGGTSPHPAAPGDGSARTAAKGSLVGEPAPRFELPDLNGATVTLRYFEGQKVVVLFWDPECGFCKEMLSDLRAWEDNRSREAPKLLVVSTGTQEASGEMGLSSPVVLDEQRAVGPAYGAPGTPSAVVVDEHGKIASELAVGAPAVLSLLAQSLQEHKETHEPIEPKS